MKLERRIRALERTLMTQPVRLRLEDGSVAEIRGPRDFLLTLFLAACDAEVSATHREQLNLIKRSISSEQPGSGRMVDLIRALIAGPAPEPGTDFPQN